MAKVRRRSLQFHRYLADASLVRILYLRRRAMVMRYSWCTMRYVFRSLVTCLPWQSGDRAFQRHHKDQRNGSQMICLLQCHAHRTVAMRYDAIVGLTEKMHRGPPVSVRTILHTTWYSGTTRAQSAGDAGDVVQYFLTTFLARAPLTPQPRSAPTSNSTSSPNREAAAA